ncbi:hypothetical protein PanWU01x14_365880 [Parasponia andersonii]|uniref:Uncharacterized protein n=1 Tax=Parasponia andersonii TaxID=3476 RepID=A0A2P5A5V5_PARAD|nr:hypothetical protein PanWU01x14_365880 [Parasponia andersonii]
MPFCTIYGLLNLKPGEPNKQKKREIKESTSVLLVDSQNFFYKNPRGAKIPSQPKSPLPNRPNSKPDAKLSSSNLNRFFSSNGYPSRQIASSLDPPKPTKPNPSPPPLMFPPFYHPRELAEST